MSAPPKLKVGSVVEIIGKDLNGIVAYIGTTHFSQGKWVGVVLNESKGKNNGVVQGKRYFTCEENYGLFVRDTQVNIISDSGSPSKSPPKIRENMPQSPSRSETDDLSIKTTSPGSVTNSPSKSVEKPVSQTVTSSLVAIPDESKNDESIEIQVQNLDHMRIISPKVSTSKISSKVSETALQNDTTSKDNTEAKLEIINLKEEVADLTGKLQTLIAKRAEDKLRLKEADKLKMQISMLEENKKLLQEKLSDYQKDISQKNKELIDVQQSFDRFREEMTDVQETIEMATLDKEMAEAKFEEAQIEMESLKSIVEELRLENEIFKTEQQLRESELNGTLSNSDISNVRDSAKVRQLEQQNERMREALVKMRDLSSHDKFELSNLQKEVDALRTDLIHITQERDTAKVLCSQLEQTNLDLQEQAHASLGSDHLITELTQRNLDLEDQNDRLKEERDDLEALCEANDEILESQREKELELIEELETTKQKYRDLIRFIDVLKETISDNEQTFQKFRKLVLDLQEQNKLLRNNATVNGTQEINSTNPQSSLLESELALSLKSDAFVTSTHVFSEQQTINKLVAMELRKLEAEQGTKHAQLLTMYLPESFCQIGGEHDAIKVRLLVDRLIFKCDLISLRIKERHPLPSVIPGQSCKFATSDDNSAFQTANEMITKGKMEFYAFLDSLCSLLDHWNYFLRFLKSVLEIGSLEQFQKLVVAQNEMALHESSLDHLLDLAKRDQLDDSVNLETLITSVQYFVNLYINILSLAFDRDHPIPNCSIAMSDLARMVSSHVTLLCTCAANIATMTGIPLSSLNEPYEEMNLLTQSGLESIEAVEKLFVPVESKGLESLLVEMVRLAALMRNRVRSIRRRIPKDSQHQPLSFNVKVVSLIDLIFSEFFSVCKCMNSSSRTLGQLAARQLEENSNLKFEEVMRECLGPAIQAEMPSGGQKSVEMKFRSKLENCATMVHRIALSMERGEYDFDGTKNEKCSDPISLRTQAYRASIQELESCRIRLETRESDLKEMQVKMKIRQQELTDLNFRANTAEQKLNNATQISEEKISNITRKLEQSEAKCNREIRELEHTVSALKTDIENLEQEKAELIDRANSQEPKGSSGPGNLIRGLMSPSMSFMQTSMTALTKGSILGDEALHLSEIKALRELTNTLMHENGRLKGFEIKKQLKELKPLVLISSSRSSLSSPGNENQSPDNALKQKKQHQSKCIELQNKLDEIYNHLVNIVSHPFMVSIDGIVQDESKSKLSPTCQFMRYQESLIKSRKQVYELQKKVNSLLENTTPHALIKSDYGKFASQSLLAKLNRSNTAKQPTPMSKILLPRIPTLSALVTKELSSLNSSGTISLHLTEKELRHLSFNLLTV